MKKRREDRGRRRQRAAGTERIEEKRAAKGTIGAEEVVEVAVEVAKAETIAAEAVVAVAAAAAAAAAATATATAAAAAAAAYCGRWGCGEFPPLPTQICLETGLRFRCS